MKKPAAPLGIIGDGQLALMLGESALAQGFDFLGFGEDRDSPFARSFPEHFIFTSRVDAESLIDFAKRCSVLTIENEFHSADLLEEVQKRSGTRIVPDPKSYRFFETKLAQRRFYEKCGIPGPKWAQAADHSDQILTQIQSSFSFSVVLKASQGGYDGYGVRMVQSADQLPSALQDLKHSDSRPVLIEEKVALKQEFAQGALFDGHGKMILLPLVETVQKNGICELVLSRPRVSSELLLKLKGEIKAHLEKIAQSGICGLYNFEFFLTANDQILINEGAPRPHNSQHLTLNASPVSQFDLLMRFLNDGTLPPLSSPIEAKPAVMLNLLGKSSGSNYQLRLPSLPPEVEVHAKLYQKKESRVGRKMGHLNLIDPTGKLDLVKLGEQVLKEYEL